MPSRLIIVFFVGFLAAACSEANIDALVPNDDPPTEIELPTTTAEAVTTTTALPSTTTTERPPPTTTSTEPPPVSTSTTTASASPLLLLASQRMGELSRFTQVETSKITGLPGTTITIHVSDDLVAFEFQLFGNTILGTAGDRPTILSYAGGPFRQYPEPVDRGYGERIDPGEIAGTLAGVTTRVTSESDIEWRIEATCDEANPAGLSTGALLCASEGSVLTGAINKVTGLLTTWQLVGDIEVWPGDWRATVVRGQISELDPDVDFDAPADYSTAEYDCVLATLGIDPGDDDGVRLALADTTTVENQALFITCGFDTWPPGLDLND
jgi:hypothetical protein